MAGKERELFTVHRDDARNLDRHLRDVAISLDPAHPEAAILTASVTSPPYGAQIDYGTSGQIGHGQADSDYLRDCKGIFEVLYRRTRDDGSLWLVADTFVERRGAPKNSAIPSGIRPLPFELANLATSVGWVLREIIIWHKDRTRPWSHHGRLRNSFEYVLLLVKTNKFKFYSSRLRDASQIAHWWVRYPERYNPHGKVPDNVWHIPLPPQGSWPGAAVEHACPFPPDLVHRLLLLSTDANDVVCDPFAGSGTVVAVAEAMGRRGIGTELNGKFVKVYKERLRPDILSKLSVDGKYHEGGGPSPRTVVQLRALKYPKALLTTARSRFPNVPAPSAIVVSVDKLNPEARNGTYANLTSTFILGGVSIDEREEVAHVLKEVSAHAPFTKYGISGDILVVDQEDARTLFEGHKFYLYEHGNTWMPTGRVTIGGLLDTPASTKRGHYMPIGSNVNVRVQRDLVGDPASDSAHVR